MTERVSALTKVEEEQKLAHMWVDDFFQGRITFPELIIRLAVIRTRQEARMMAIGRLTKSQSGET